MRTLGPFIVATATTILLYDSIIHINAGDVYFAFLFETYLRECAEEAAGFGDPGARG